VPAPDRAGAAVDVTDRLLAKYGIATPRYTSYPAAPYWGPLSPDRAEAWLAAPPAGDGSLSLYTHIPFCSHRCLYCACFVVITPHVEQADRYVEALIRELSLVRGRMSGERRVRQFHLGGGTPTFLPQETMARWVAACRAEFRFEPDAEMSIEVDPRTVAPEALGGLRELGFNRLSLGVQDFDPAVQETVERIQPYEQVAALVEVSRDLAFQSVNFDLIYGLPQQSRVSFARTVEQVLSLRPDRLAIYHYAHLPQSHPHQRKLPREALPAPAERTAMFLEARRRLIAAGYVAIGLDHFALPGDELSRAMEQGRMRRNFMGYTTQAGIDLLSFGISAISEVGENYWQNEKKLVEYYRLIEAGRLPIVRGIELGADDRLRKAIIAALFCTGRVDFAALAEHFGIVPGEHLAPEIAQLAPFAADGLLAVTDGGIVLTPLGQVLCRNIAAVFDAHLRAGRAHPVTFSRTL
jgi:oxygen-independent coproporphyrinogen-3 oxidase